MSALARWCFRHRWFVLVGWLAALVVLGGVSQTAGTDFRNRFSLPGTESQRAIDLLKQNFPAQSGETDSIVLHARTGTVRDPAVVRAASEMFERVSRLRHVAAVGSPFTPNGARQVSGDGRTAFATVALDGQGPDIPTAAVKELIATARAADSPRLQVELGGGAISRANRSFGSGSELIGVVAAAVILFVSLGSLLATLLPLVTAIVALGIGLSLVGLLSHGLTVAEFGPTLATLIGLGVGIDYALFIVSRHRAGLRAGRAPEESAVAAVATAGRAVLFAGTTVCLALLGLFTLRVTFIYGVALAAVIAVAVTMAAALTLLPALLSLLGLRVLSRRERRRLAAEGAAPVERPGGFWSRWAHLVERRRAVLGVGAFAVVAVLAVPFFSLRLGVADQGNDPGSQTTRRAYDLLADGFGPGFNGPLQLAAQLRGPGDRRALDRLVATVADEPGVAAVSTTPTLSPNGRVATVNVYPTTSPQDEATSTLLHHLRSDVIPTSTAGSHLDVAVGGATAVFDDFSGVLGGRLPVFIGSVVAVAFLLLTVMFRSLLIPLTASVMNLLAVGAAFGVMTAVFQWGWAASLIGIDRTGPIDAGLPVLAFAVLFGLSMDYEVFLISRMHELWVAHHDNRRAVTQGQSETGRVVTAAAGVMVLVFASFIFGGERAIKLFGLGFSAAVLIDAFVIRTVLIPSLMHIFGRANWWLPRPLERALPRLSVEAGTPVAGTRDGHGTALEDRIPEPAQPG